MFVLLIKENETVPHSSPQRYWRSGVKTINQPHYRVVRSVIGVEATSSFDRFFLFLPPFSPSVSHA